MIWDPWWVPLSNILSLIIFLASIIGVAYFSHRDALAFFDELKNRSYEETTEDEA